MNLNRKKLILEIVIILIVAIFFALINNLISENPLPLIRTEQKLETVDDSVLFGENTAQQKHIEMTVSYEQILKLLNKPDVLFIDARSPEQYAEGHIGKAINIFPLMEDQTQLYEMVNNLPLDKIFIVYCDGGSCDLSHELIKILYEFGFNQSFLYSGGWEEWTKKQGLSK